MSDEISQIISDSIASIEDTSTPEPTESATPEPNAGADAAVEAAPAAEAASVPDEEAELGTLEKELVEKDPRLNNGQIATRRHQAVLTRQRRQAEAEKAELLAKYEKVKQFENYDPNRLRALEIAETDHDRFVEILQGIPQYKAIFDGWRQPAAPAAAPAAPVAEEPRPDVLLSDGSLAYSAEGQQKVIEYRLAKEREAYRKELEELRGTVKPILEERQSRVNLDKAMVRMKPVLENARATWDGFADNEGEIKAAWQANPRMTLEGAYQAVMIPKFKADKTKLEADIRAQVIKDMNEKSKGSSAIRPVLPEAIPGAGNTDDEITAIIRQSFRA